MDEARLRDRLYWGLNRTANILGRVADAYRPDGCSDPLAGSNKYLKLQAAFSRIDGNFAQPVGYGIATWRGHFDASYTQVGDYLVQGNDTWFIASQHSLLPVMCVKTNRIISITRQTPPTAGSSVDLSHGNSTFAVISQWPASLLGTVADGKPPTQLPRDTAVPGVIALLPSSHKQALQPTDIVTDEYGTTGIVFAAELSDLGWRLNVRHITT